MEKENSLLNLEMGAEHLVKEFEQERSERTPLDSIFQELADLTFPRLANITSIRLVDQSLNNQEVYDDTAQQANITFANGMHAYHTPSGSEWFNYKNKYRELESDEEVKEWFSDATRIVSGTLSNSNFYEQRHENYLSLGGFGTACFFVDEDEREIVRFYNFSVPHGVYIWEDSRGRVNKVMRCFEYTTIQAIEEFGKDNVGKNVMEAYAAKEYGKKFKFLHCVGERYAFEAGKKDSKNLPIYSKYVNVEMKKIVQEKGYHEMPYFVSRFYKAPTSKYGFSPNMLCLPSIKSANRARMQILQAADIAIQPPIEAPYKGYNGRINLNSRAVNYRRDGMEAAVGIKPIITIDPRGYAFSGDNLNDLREGIKRAYFVNMFLSLEEKSGMTATEVAERKLEKMSQIGPFLSRLKNEQDIGILHRLLMIHIRSGKIPPPPVQLQGMGGDYGVGYLSMLELSQKTAKVTSLKSYYADMGSLAQMNPEILDNIDFDAGAKIIEDCYNVDPKVSRRPEERDAIRAQRAEQAQQQAMLQAMQVASQTGKNVASAEKDLKQGEQIGRQA